ncbi:hypothetical protein [Puia dinghuensis]|uniref:Uncharacterized protein n=1 Tax=Puia dinghuensis TaxID=1792502 RepID=A0A8J2XSC7_9BACT|nr:hypothetical protein [Puia dinghuensis]GGA94060.1 hypothetical protein GCM10011511_16710 [Puia dinghuensis]
MKTSNKLILGFILGFFGLAIAVHLVLYSEYRKGHFVTAQQMHEEDYIKQPIPASRVIFIDGAIWVNLAPAREFALDLPRKNEDPDAHMFIKNAASPQAITWRQQGDTLFITGNITASVHRPFSDGHYRANLPQVTVYGPAFDDVVLNHGQVYLQGAGDSTMGLSARLLVLNSTVWVGMQYELYRPAPREYFDSINIRSFNSIVVLNAHSTVENPLIHLHDHSELKDQSARLTHPTIYCTPESHVDLSGDNLKKTQVITQ